MPGKTQDLTGRIEDLEQMVGGLHAEIRRTPSIPATYCPVEATSFIIRDGAGRRRVVLGMDLAAPASLTLLDAAEEVRTEMSVQSDGCAKLALFGKPGGGAGGMLSACPDGSVVLAPYDQASHDSAR
jgi:hypothetical protein